MTGSGTTASNTAVGYYAGRGATTGYNNVYLGQNSGYYGTAHTTGLGSTYLGAYAGASAAAATSELVVAAGGIQTGKGSSTGFISPAGGAVYQGNNFSTWGQVSDRRLKKNIVDSTIGLAEINQLQVRNFEYRTADELTELAATDVVPTQGVQVGVIAQEIQGVLPNCVTEESTGVLSLNADNLTWHLIKAVQELSATNDALVARITALEGA